LPNLADLEAAANRRYWFDVFQPRSAPAALRRTDFFDWSPVFAEAATERAERARVMLADGLLPKLADDLPAPSAARTEVAAEAPDVVNTASAAETLAASEVDHAAGDIAGIIGVSTTVPVETAVVAAFDVGTDAASAADAAVPAVEVAAVILTDVAASATDVPLPVSINVPADAKAAAGGPGIADLAQPTAQEAVAVFTLDRAGWRLVSRVNRRLNREIRQVSDDRLYGVEDFWQRPEGSRARGDCEDYVLAKRAALIAEGVPAEALSIAIVETRWGESHAVLLLASDRGEFILDSLSPWVTRWDRVDYAWRERQLPGRPFDWVQVAI
jgi:predicted transglutaminase-like cysteine proteinase